MSADTILKDEEGNSYSFDNLATQRWLEGQESGALAAMQYLRGKAIKAFEDKKDKEAVLLRDLADEIGAKVLPQLREKAQKHADDFPYEIQVEKA